MRNLLHTLLLVFAIVGIASPVFALTVSPARVEITGDPGATLQGKIELFNEQEGERTFFTSFENFEPSGESGAPHFIGAKNGLATWMQSEAKVVIESGKRSIVPFSITIPADAEPGGHFAAVFFGSQAPGAQGSGEVSIGGKIGVLVLLRVSGEVAEGGGLLEFTTKEKQRFFSTLPVALTYRLNNTGGDRVVPNGEITIKNTLRLTSATLLANKNEGSVLPSSARKFEVVWESEGQETGLGFFEVALKQWNDLHFGWYTANLNLVYGDDLSQTAHSAYSFFIIPWQLFTIVLLTLGLVWFVFKMGIARFKRKIIAEAMRNKQ